MRKFRSRVFVAAVAVCAVAVAGIATVGVSRVAALGGLNSGVGVSIFSPVNHGQTLNVVVYTPGAQLPATLPVGVKTEVSVTGTPLPLVESVKTALGGTLDTAARLLTNERQLVEATKVTDLGNEGGYFAVVDARNLAFQPMIPARGGAGLMASDFIRTLVIANGYAGGRSVADITEFSEFAINVNVLDSTLVDTDGNGIPDATSLAQSFLQMIGPTGEVTFVISLNTALARGGAQVTFTTAVQSASGPINIGITAPTLSALQAADASLNTFDTARLIVTVGPNPAQLLDAPAEVDPLGEFALVDADAAPLPAPQKIFARVNIAVATLAVVRGVAPTWTFLDTLPGALRLNVELSGPGIAAILRSGVDVGFYTYDTTASQNGENITVRGDELGWAEAQGLALFNNDNADDAADAVRIVTAGAGDDSIVASSSNASAIFSSNASPGLSAGGNSGSGSLCFIATAAFGTPLAKEIGALRQVRDRFMLGNSFGAIFVDAYYRVSPPLAERVSEHAFLGSVVRAALTPVVALSRVALATPGLFAGALVTLLLAVGVAVARHAHRDNRFLRS